MCLQIRWKIKINVVQPAAAPAMKLTDEQTERNHLDKCHLLACFYKDPGQRFDSMDRSLICDWTDKGWMHGRFHIDSSITDFEKRTCKIWKKVKGSPGCSGEDLPMLKLDINFRIVKKNKTERRRE